MPSPSRSNSALFALLASAAVLAGAGVVGCSDEPTPQTEADAGEADAGPPPFTAGELCDSIARAECDLLARCFASFNRLEANDCFVERGLYCQGVTQAIAAAVNDGRAKFDDEAYKACLSRLQSASCPAALPTASALPVARAFDDCSPERLFIGNVDTGQTCKTRGECKKGNDCIIFSGACGGVCAPYYEIGEPCGAGTCNPETSFCDSATGYCAPLKNEGEGCETSAECNPSLSCLAKQCLPPPPLLSPCTFAEDRLPYCGAGLACDQVPYAPDPGECVVRKSEGDACAYHYSCRAGLVCAGIGWGDFPNSSPTRGKCSKPKQLDQPCSFTPYSLYLGDECAPGLYCDEKTNKCNKRPHDGEACALQLQNCIGSYCKPEASGGGKCGLAPAIGEACIIDMGANQFPLSLPCRDGYCDKDSKTCQPANRNEGEACYADKQCLTDRCVVQQDKSRKCGKRC